MKSLELFSIASSSMMIAPLKSRTYGHVGGRVLPGMYQKAPKPMQNVIKSVVLTADVFQLKKKKDTTPRTHKMKKRQL